MKMIVFIMLCFLLPAGSQNLYACMPSHSPVESFVKHSVNEHKVVLNADVEDDNEDEDENESATRKFRLLAGSRVSFADILLLSNPDLYKNSPVLLSHLSARYIFHGVLRI